MKTAELEVQKAELARIILSITDEKVVRKLQNTIIKIVAPTRELKPMTREEYRAMVDQSIEDARAGRVISAEDMKKEIAQWGTR